MTASPVAETHVFHDKNAPYALIIGVYNEGGKFTAQLERLQPYRPIADILIADGGSSDGATLPAMLREKTRALLVNRDDVRGLSVQYRIALQFALEQGYEGMIMMDGNGKDGADAIPAFIAQLAADVDFIQGSRFLPGGRHERTPRIRVLGIRYMFNPLMQVACRFRYTDAMNGFKACSARLLTDPRVQPLRPVFVRYGLQYYLNYIAPRLGFRVTEIPVSRVYPERGPYSKINGIGAYLRILGELLATVSGRYRPKM